MSDWPFGILLTSSWRSITVLGIPRWARSIASAIPTGPPPTTMISLVLEPSESVVSAVAISFTKNCLSRVNECHEMIKRIVYG